MNEPGAGLVIKMRQFDLQPALGRRGALPKNLEDQAGPIDDLALQPIFQVALLDRGKGTIDDDQLGLLHLAVCRDVLDLPFPEQGSGTGIADRHDDRIDNDQTDGKGKAFSFFKA